jgi:hypothetical protein
LNTCATISRLCFEIEETSVEDPDQVTGRDGDVEEGLVVGCDGVGEERLVQQAERGMVEAWEIPRRSARTRRADR